jgi:hypothetical protein
MKKDEVDSICNTHEEMRNVYKMWVRKPQAKRPVGIPKGRKEDNIKMNLKVIRV